MKVLVIGGGGREHALCWKISRSPQVKQVFCAPGNAGIASVAERISLEANDLFGLLEFAKKEKIDLTVVGPEEPLCLGIVDLFQKEKLRIFGPTRRAAEIEGSKVFCKELLQRHRIPTAAFRRFDSSGPAMAYLETNHSFPIVVKASGLAAGKGVTICRTRVEAREAVEKAMEEKVFGQAGETLIVEEYLTGEEVSILTVTDGETIIPFEPSQDHKPIFEKDKGPNTGGMGAICPTPAVSSRTLYQIETQILVPTIHALNREGRKFRGVLYAGVIMTDSGPKVLEFNVRFGDPEAQAVLMRLRSDLFPFLLYTAEGNLKKIEEILWDPRSSACVVAASGGYPGNYQKGREIEGLEDISLSEDLQVFHAGTSLRGGKVVTSGGRVLGVTALGEDLRAAREKAYDNLSKIRFEGIYYRKDIGTKALKE